MSYPGEQRSFGAANEPFQSRFPASPQPQPQWNGLSGQAGQADTTESATAARERRMNRDQRDWLKPITIRSNSVAQASAPTAQLGSEQELNENERQPRAAVMSDASYAQHLLQKRSPDYGGSSSHSNTPTADAQPDTPTSPHTAGIFSTAQQQMMMMAPNSANKKRLNLLRPLSRANSPRVESASARGITPRSRAILFDEGEDGHSGEQAAGSTDSLPLSAQSDGHKPLRLSTERRSAENTAAAAQGHAPEVQQGQAAQEDLDEVVSAMGGIRRSESTEQTNGLVGDVELIQPVRASPDIPIGATAANTARDQGRLTADRPTAELGPLTVRVDTRDLMARDATGGHDDSNFMMYRKEARNTFERAGDKGLTYVESKRTGEFVKIDRNVLTQMAAAASKHAEEVQASQSGDLHKRLEVEAESVEKAAQRARSVQTVLIMFMQGLAAGITLLDLHIVRQGTSDEELLGYYSIFCDGVRLSCYILLMMSFTGVLEGAVAEYRTPDLWNSRSRWGRARLVALVTLYLIATLCTLIATPISDRITLRYDDSKTWFTNATAMSAFSAQLSRWKNLGVARFVGAFFGWLLSALDHLHRIAEHSFPGPNNIRTSVQMH